MMPTFAADFVAYEEMKTYLIDEDVDLKQRMVDFEKWAKKTLDAVNRPRHSGLAYAFRPQQPGHALGTDHRTHGNVVSKEEGLPGGSPQSRSVPQGLPVVRAADHERVVLRALPAKARSEVKVPIS